MFSLLMFATQTTISSLDFGWNLFTSTPRGTDSTSQWGARPRIVRSLQEEKARTLLAVASASRAVIKPRPFKSRPYPISDKPVTSHPPETKIAAPPVSRAKVLAMAAKPRANQQNTRSDLGTFAAREG